MSQDNPFEAHGVRHLSPSSINKFIDSPAKWLTNVAGFRDNLYKPAFTFGNAIEAGITAAICDGEEIQGAIDAAHQEVAKIHKEAPKGYDFEACNKKSRMIERVLSVAVPEYKEFGVPISTQRWVEHKFEGIPIPVGGILDYEYKNVVRDLKTTGRKPSENPKYCRQLAVYALATDKMPKIDYVYWTSKQCQLITMDVGNLSSVIESVERIANKMMKLLSLSDDIYEICSITCFEPDISNSDWWNQWGPNEITGAKKLFSIT